MAYVDHPTTDVGKMSDARYTSYETHVEALSGTSLVDISSDLTITSTKPASEIHVFDATPGGAGGGYVASTNNGLGILAPYHQRLIDGLYAGGRIHYQ
mgnify:CR=1 FL=1